MMRARRRGRQGWTLGGALLLAVLGIGQAQAAAPQSGTPADTSSSGSVAAPDPQHGKVLYLQHCTACHGARGWGDGPREIPAVAGQHEAYIAAQLTRFASGERPGSAVHGPAMRDTLKAPDLNRGPAIRDLAAYLARAPAAPQLDQGAGRALSAGRSAYLRSCAACHGEEGLGADGAATPRIGGQHYRYLLSRLAEFAVVHRGQTGESGLSAEDREAVADYLSRVVAPPRAP